MYNVAMEPESRRAVEPLPLYAPAVRLELASGSLAGPPVVEVTRTLADLKGIFAAEPARAALPQDTLVYRVQCWQPVAEGNSGGLFFGATFLEAGTVGGEYFITKGHLHALRECGEYYWGIRGMGVLLLMDAERRCRAERVEPGSLHYIAGGLAHRVANIGDETLCFGACWPADAGHDYESIALSGFSARVLRVGGLPTVIAVDEESGVRS